jgi:diaminopimelate epimerase
VTLTAYSACGNTFIVISGAPVPESDKPCYVLENVGQYDGAIFIEGTKENPVMDYFNRDGSRGEMCGNGARTFIKALFDRKWAAIGESMSFQTRSGMLAGRLLDSDSIVVSMPEPIYLGGFAHKGWQGYFYRVGVPHLVFYMDNRRPFDVERIGYDFSHLEETMGTSNPFRFSTNVNFLTINETGINVRTYERGVWRETRSCGTGSVACASLFRKWRYPHLNQVQVQTKGGQLTVIWEKDRVSDRETVFLKGKVERIS